MNNDESIDLSDVAPFVGVLLEQNVDPIALCASDVNGDGLADGGDVDHFVASLVCGCGCTVETDCPLGRTCVDGLRLRAAGADLELSDSNAPCVTGPCAPLEDGGVFELCGRFSGFTELYLTIRVTAFEANPRVDISWRLTAIPVQACDTQPDCPPLQPCLDRTCVIGGGDFFGLQMNAIGGGVQEFELMDILFSGPTTLDGQDAILSVTVTDSDNPAITVSTTMQVTLDVPLFCFFQGQCPPNHVCMGNYCFPN